MVNISVTTGVWQDYSHPGWKGSILTLDIQYSTLLISGLATFVTLVGTRFWAIVVFVLYQLRASSKEKDGIHHQHQVMYRNGSTALGTAWTAIRISWAWRNRAHRNIPRLIAVIIPPILCFAGFAAASVLTAKVAAAPYLASQVKLSKQNCGFLDWSVGSNVLGDVTQEGSRVYGDYFVNAAIAARNYARSCYGSRSQTLASCNLYPTPSIPYETNSNTPCPFKGSRCILGDEAAFQMRTPWLSSHVHFGINAPFADRVDYRRITTCSVLNVTDLISSRRSSSGTIYYWHLGYTGPLSARSNTTFSYNDNTANLGIGYTIRPNFAVEKDDYPGWIPTSDLKHTDADVSIFFLAQNSVVYQHPVDDPFYSAHRKFEDLSQGAGTAYYSSDDLVTVMGCIDQFQLRDPTTNFSTTPSGLQSMKNQSFSIGLNPAQVAASARLVSPSESSLMFNSVNGLQSAALKAQDSLFITISSGLPSNQWQIELQGWFDTALAQLQSSIIQFVSKDIDSLVPYAQLFFPFDKENMQRMCDNQIILTVGNYQSFSLMGVEIIIVVGAVIVLLSLIIDVVVGCCQRRSIKQRYKEILWTTDSVLQQQRLAAESVGVKGWEKTKGAVPITKLGKVWRSTPS